MNVEVFSRDMTLPVSAIGETFFKGVHQAAEGHYTLHVTDGKILGHPPPYWLTIDFEGAGC